MFKTPWPGDPRVNVQNDHGMAKAYQVRVLAAIEEGGWLMSEPIIDVTRYTYRVTWSGEDDQFVATCVELHSLSWLADTQEEALGGLRDLVAVAMEAAAEHLSLNQYLVRRLSDAS